MAKGFIGASGCKAYLGAIKMRKGYIGATRVYSAGNIVTYHVDTGATYQEEIDEGASCLAPKTFTPAKSGWTFVGWRADSTASGSVLSSKIMSDDPVTLYAVFRQTVTVTYYNNSITASSTSGYRYYNNGNTVNPTFSLTPTSRSGWTFRGWATSSAAAASIAYSSISGTAFAASVTVYACYSQTITLSYNGNGNTGGSVASQTGTTYWNTGNVSYPSFTLAANGFTKSGYSFLSWAMGSTDGMPYQAGASVTLSASTTMYAVWKINTFKPIINGKLQSGYYTSASRIVENSSGGYDLPDTINYLYAYGHYGLRTVGWTSQGASISFNTNGCSQVTILPFYHALNGQYMTTSLVVRGDGNQIYNSTANTETVINVSGYTSIEVTFKAMSDQQGWLAGGIQTITCS